MFQGSYGMYFREKDKRSLPVEIDVLVPSFSYIYVDCNVI